MLEKASHHATLGRKQKGLSRLAVLGASASALNFGLLIQ